MKLSPDKPTLLSHRIRVWLMVGLLLSAASTAWTQSATALRVVRSAAVLEAPDEDASVLGTVAPTEILELLDERDSWYLVRSQGDDAQREWRTGWVSQSTVERLEGGFVPERPTVPSAVTRPQPANPRGSDRSRQAVAPIRLSQITRIYIEEMPNDLHAYIAAEMMRKFKGRIEPVLNPDQADAILTGTGESQSGFGAAVTGRWLGLHDTASAAVILTDWSGIHLLWADEAGDRSLFWGSLTRSGPRKVASRLMKHLDDAIKDDLRNGR